MTNLQENLTQTNLEVLTEVLNTYFEMHQAEESEATLEELLQAWICPDVQSTRTNMEIADQVFFVNNISSLIRKVSAWDFSVQTIDQITESRRLIKFEFFHRFDFDYYQEIIQNTLQCWICPNAHSITSHKTIADVVSAFDQLRKFIRACNKLVKGEALCA